MDGDGSTEAEHGPRPAASHSSHEEQLYAQWVSGDRRALEALLGSLRPALSRYLTSLGCREVVRDDIVQESLLAIYRARRPLHGFVRAYVFKTARNLQISARKREFGRTGGGNGDADLEKIEERPSYTDALDAAHNRSLYVQCLRRIKPEYLEALILHKYGGLSYREIARVLDCQESRARRMAYEAVRQFKAAHAQLMESSNKEVQTSTSLSELADGILGSVERRNSENGS